MRTEKGTIFSKYKVVLSFREPQISGKSRVGALIMCLYSRQEPLHNPSYIYLKMGEDHEKKQNSSWESIVTFVTTYNIQVSGRNGKVVEYFLKIAPYPCALLKVNSISYLYS